MTMILVATLLTLQAAGVPAPQSTPSPLIAPSSLPKVVLTDLRGAEHHGRLLRVEPAEVTLVGVDGERIFKRHEIVQIEKRGDSLRNGAIIGATVGVAAGLLAAGISDCPGVRQDGCAGSRVAMFVTSTAFYTVVGVGIDALVQGRTVLYRAHPKVDLSLHAQPGRAGVGLTFKW